MKREIEDANRLSLEQPRVSKDSEWGEIYQWVKKYPYNGLIDINFGDDVKFTVLCLNDDAIALQYLWSGGSLSEPISFEIWKILAKNSRCTLDVGAYTGFYSLIASCVSKSKVYSYEPVSFIYARLASNAMLNGFSQIKFENIAVSNNIGALDIGIRFGPKIFSSGSSIVEDQLQKAPILQSTRTDTLDARHKKDAVDLIKIDVEGAETMVLEGMQEILAYQRPVLLLETRQATYGACSEMLHSHGYEALFVETSGGAKNHIFYHKQSHLYNEISGVAKLIEKS